MKLADMLNVYPAQSGEIRSLPSGMNAVIVNYLPGEPDESGNPQYMRVISIACSDDNMLPFLREAAHQLIR